MRHRLALLAALLMTAGCGAGEEQARPSSSATPSAALRTVPAGDTEHDTQVTLEPGDYRVPESEWSVAPFTVTFPAGWTAQYGHVFAQHFDEPDEFGFYAVEVDEVFRDACRGEGGPTREVGPAVDDLITALREQTGGAVVSAPVRTTLGGFPAKRVDLRIPGRLDLGRCQMASYGFTGLQVWYSRPADKYFVLLPGAVAHVYVVDVRGRRQVFLAQVGNPGSAADRAELQAVIDSIRIAAESPGQE